MDKIYFLYGVVAGINLIGGLILMVLPKQVTKRLHPEMEGVEPGEKLMGVTFKSCDLEEYAALQERIEVLRQKLEEEEDDDGDVPAIVRR